MKIVLTDVHKTFRQRLRAILEREGFTIVAEAEDGVEALRLAMEKKPDIVVLDINTPLRNGFELTREITRQGLTAQVVMLSVFKDEVSVFEAFRAGVKAYVLKAQAATELGLAIRQLVAGKYYLSPGITELLVDAYPGQGDGAVELLTEMEMQILQRLTQDDPASEIARQLSLSIKSVESHRKEMMHKLQASNLGGLVRHAIRRGVLGSVAEPEKDFEPL